MRLIFKTIVVLFFALPTAMAGETPRPLIPDDNFLTRTKAELGRRLFYDTRFSVTGAYACASCHNPALAFSDGRKVAIGATGETHRRNTPSLGNVVFRPVLTWSHPRLRRLEKQLLTPLFGSLPIEMGLRTTGTKLLSVLHGDGIYPAMFRDAFGKADGVINLDNFAKALASFQRTLISFNAPYDRDALSPSARRGASLFFGERLNCFQCHPAPHFTDNYKSRDLPVEEIAFHNTGIDATGGLYEHTGRDSDQGRFRTPSLRNVAVTAPYMHDGSITTLAEVLGFYCCCLCSLAGFGI